ncbi:Integrin-like protein [Candidatus Koribacter versatilis Ellin345]|uniref:Integrin-like protein n=1 Tax=Koribacter versatilis (strain Ellin345) TaxID=204669 RepID=Q1IRW1_KORVE|nr:FG-GAP-like repeat-containing protein [Candidatus Koribacter versatilis]ABF40389.1 Integrin-like protein [Candidatus Koribacter versatilis Ellin345]
MKNSRIRLLAVPLLLASVLLFVPPIAIAGTSTTTTLTITSGGSSVSSVTPGTVVALNALVKAGSTAVLPGTVRFCDTSVNSHCLDGALLGTAQLLSDGSASIKLRLGVATHSIQAKFDGTLTYSASASSTSSLTVSGGKSPTLTTLSWVSGSTSVSATVAGFPPSTVTTSPSGTVTLLDTSHGNAVVGTGSLTAGSLGDGTVSFFPSQTLFDDHDGNNPRETLFTDLNGDGIPDLILVNSAYNVTGHLSIWLGNGDGTFQPPLASYAIDKDAQGLLVADFNNDGIPDVAVGSDGGTLIWIFPGNGDGTLNAPVYVEVEHHGDDGDPHPLRLVAGDFNHDGNLDIAAATSGNLANSIMVVLIGNGDGTFHTPVRYNFTGSCSGVSEHYLVGGDLNGDGNVDLVMNDDECSNLIWVFIGNGDGTFQTPYSVTVTTASEVESPIVAGDFDGDGVPDIAVIGADEQVVHVLLSKGDGTFKTPASYGIGQVGLKIATTDFNGDHIPDLVILNSYDSTLSVLLGKGDGTFLPQITLPSLNYGLNVADLNGDGKPDIASTSNPASNTLKPLPPQASIMLNASDAASATVSFDVTSLLASGVHVLQASYPGDANYSAGVSRLLPLVGIGATTLNMSLYPEPVPYGGTVTLTATLTPNSGTDGEIISFFTNGSHLGTATLSSGVATLSTSTLAAGLNLLTASYAGNVNYSSSVSDPVDETVRGIETTLSLGARPNPASYGSPVSLKATLTPSAGTDGEQISFYEQVSPSFSARIFIGTATLASGVATLSTSALGVGDHSLWAAYPGDTTHDIESSSTVSETVLGTAPALTLGANPKPVDHGHLVTLTATISPSSGTDGERITFFSNGNILGSSALSSGVATLSTAALVAGTDSLTASYPGDANYGNRTSNTVSVTVNPPASTTTVLHVSPPRLSTPATVVLSATVTASSAPLSPGQVKFCDASINASCSGNAFLGIAQLLSNGTAQLTTRLGFGVHNLQAAFVGQRNYASSSSSVVVFHQSWKTGAAMLWITASTGTLSGSYDLSVTLDGLMNSSTPAAPAGSVSFLDASNSNAVVATGSLVAASAPALTLKNVFQPTIGTNPDTMAFGDFNHDGIPDMAISGWDNNLWVLLGNGDGTFTVKPSLPLVTLSGPDFRNHPLVVADLNGDGNIDVAVTNRYGKLAVFLGNGDGTFQSPLTTNLPGGTSQMISADVNGDGKPDLVLIGGATSPILILLGNGDGTFITGSAPVDAGLCGTPYQNSIASNDFNEDGVPDLVLVPVANPSSPQPGCVLFGNGDGTYSRPQSLAVGNGAGWVATADLNGDGHADLVVTDSIANTVSVSLGNGDGTFQTAVPYAVGLNPEHVTIADLNQDGKPDLIVTNDNYHGTVSILLGNGNGTFQPQQTINAGGNSIFTALTDMNGDGKPDIAVVNYQGAGTGPERLSVFLNYWGRNATATANNVIVTGTGTHQIKGYFPGDTNYRQGTSAGVGLTAVPAAPQK